METEAKQLIQEGLELFAFHDRKTLKEFYFWAEKYNVDLSQLDEKYQTFERCETKGLFLSLLIGVVDAVGHSKRKTLYRSQSSSVTRQKLTEYEEKKLILKYKIKDFREMAEINNNTAYLLYLIDSYCK